MRKRTRKRSLHHLIPKSRGGSDDPDNIRRISDKIHRAWHMVFGNMTPDEAVDHIKDHWAPLGYFKEGTQHAGPRTDYI